MATQNIAVSGGRTSGGSSYTPDDIQRQVADNSAVFGALGGLTGGTTLPQLDANVMDRLFATALQRANAPTGMRTDASEPSAPGTATSISSFGALSQSASDSGALYDGLGWNLGWNTAGTGVRRGAEALGLRENAPGTDLGNGPVQSGGRYANLTEVAGLANIDPTNYRNADGTLNESALRTAVDEALKDYYLVSGDTGGIPGYSGAAPFRFTSSLYKRDGDVLRAIAGTQNTFQAPQNSAGHFAENLAPIVSILAAPIFSGLGILGQTGSLTTSIAGATGVSPTVANIIGNALVRGGITAASGGDFIRGAATSAIGAGVTPFISEAAGQIAGPGTTGAAALGGLGNLGLSAALNGGRLSPMGAVGTFIDAFGRGGKTRQK